MPQVLAAVGDLARAQPTDPQLGPATVVATDVEALPRSRNVIPDRVTVALDWRILPSQERDELLRQVERALAGRLTGVPEGWRVTVQLASERQTTWTGLETVRELLTPGFLMSLDHPVVRAAAAVVGRREGSGPARARPWTFATDGGWCAGVHGIPTVGFAPGEERHAHTNRERLDLDEARWAFGRYPGLVLAVMEALAVHLSREPRLAGAQDRPGGSAPV
jgi:acetylornithine deacetylase/succinyl-diaminopimelate desuccinylase-like protein